MRRAGSLALLIAFGLVGLIGRLFQVQVAQGFGLFRVRDYETLVAGYCRVINPFMNTHFLTY